MKTTINFTELEDHMKRAAFDFICESVERDNLFSPPESLNEADRIYQRIKPEVSFSITFGGAE